MKVIEYLSQFIGKIKNILNTPEAKQLLTHSASTIEKYVLDFNSISQEHRRIEIEGSAIDWSILYNRCNQLQKKIKSDRSYSDVCDLQFQYSIVNNTSENMVISDLQSQVTKLNELLLFKDERIRNIDKELEKTEKELKEALDKVEETKKNNTKLTKRKIELKSRIEDKLKTITNLEEQITTMSENHSSK